MTELDKEKPKTKTQPDSGSGGIPPRPTAVGAPGSDDEFHVGQSLGCVVIGHVPGGYLVELAAEKKVKIRMGSTGEEFEFETFNHAVLMSDRKLRIGERTMAMIVRIEKSRLWLEDSVVGTVPRQEKVVDSTLPGSGGPAFSKPRLPEHEDISVQFPELEQIPDKPKAVKHLELPPSTLKCSATHSQSHSFEDQKKFSLNCSSLVALFDPVKSWERQIYSIQDFSSLLDQLAMQKFSGIANLCSGLNDEHVIFFGGQYHLTIKSNPHVLLDKAEAGILLYQRMIENGSLVMKYHDLHNEILTAVLALVNGSPLSKENEFDSLRDLTNYFLTVSAWNRSDSLLVLQSGEQALLVVVSAGEFVLAWNCFDMTISGTLLAASDFIAEHPDARAWMYDLNASEP